MQRSLAKTSIQAFFGPVRSLAPQSLAATLGEVR